MRILQACNLRKGNVSVQVIDEIRDGYSHRFAYSLDNHGEGKICEQAMHSQNFNCTVTLSLHTTFARVTRNRILTAAFTHHDRTCESEENMKPESICAFNQWRTRKPWQAVNFL